MPIVIQRESRLKHIPSDNLIIKWINLLSAQLHKKRNNLEVTVRIVNKKESADLNKKYRQKSGPTNVLSFSYTLKPVCGDIVLCAPLIPDEKTWAHLIIHGVLHLMGYDHVKAKEAAIMENLEMHILRKLNNGR